MVGSVAEWLRHQNNNLETQVQILAELYIMLSWLVRSLCTLFSFNYYVMLHLLNFKSSFVIWSTCTYFFPCPLPPLSSYVLFTYPCTRNNPEMNWYPMWGGGGGGGGHIYQHISSVCPNEQEMQPVLKLNGIIQK